MYRLLDARLPFFAYGPTRVLDLPYLEAIHTAGGLPVVDAEFFDAATIMEAARRLDEKNILFAVRVATKDTVLIDRLYQETPHCLDVVILAATSKEGFDTFTPPHRDVKLVMEVTDIGMQDAINRIRPDGLILKGLEAGGLVSKYTGFILLQWYLAHCDLPVFLHGGVGFHTAAGMLAAGAAGVVLDSQLWLAKESPLSDNFRKLLFGFEEFDTLLIEGPHDTRFRFFAKLGTKIAHDLKKNEALFALSGNRDDTATKAFFATIREQTAALNDGKVPAVQSLFYLGQDAAFSRHFAARGTTVTEIVTAFFTEIRSHIADIATHDPLRPDTPLAKEHGTRLPVIQGPMANVSDNPDFAEKIAQAGGLPFFAMGSLPKDLAETMLKTGAEKKIPYGAGLIGMETFNKTLSDHLDLVRQWKSPFALFAGGVPAQVKELEAAGTKTYLHTPASMMLENAITFGCNRFILEGTECGGHVGSLTSLVLWELGTERLLTMSDTEIREKTLIYAGGISTAPAAHFISGIGASLARRGAKVGIQVGSAYLFTREIVETGSLFPRYQKEILQRNETLVIGRTVGLPSRTVATPFSLSMRDAEFARLKKGRPLSERKTAFEEDNMGSLLIGAKGMLPDFENDPKTLLHFKEEEVFAKGNFCVGDSLAFFKETLSIADIHDRYFATKAALRKNLDALERSTRPDHEIFDEIAIVGMGCVMPDADSPEAFWQNIIDKKVSIRKMPEDRLDPIFYDPDKTAEDKTYTKIAGVITDLPFDGTRYGLTKDQSQRISRSQKLVIKAAAQAAAAAGYTPEKPLPKSTAVILASCLGNEMINDLHMKYYTPQIRSVMAELAEFRALPKEEQKRLFASVTTGLAKGYDSEPPDTAVLNIEASRVAALLDVEGPNYVVDAACATSFAAIDCGIRELLSGKADAVVAGGLNTTLAPETFVGFSKMGALSAEGSWPFDGRASGFVLGEGAGVFILKRMRDAMAEKDTIFGVIKGMGSSSDGKGKAIAAPNPKGQLLALSRCYEGAKSPITPKEIAYVEAHGTSTIMGDKAEIETLREFYGDAPKVGVSSVKSQVGHLLGGAGAAGLLKVLLALGNKTLPPNGQFRKLAPAHDMKGSGLYIIEEAAPWETEDGSPRKAAVSSYGFGGINYHCVVEEYTEHYRPLARNVFPDLSWNHNDDRIVVAGLGTLLPKVDSPEAFWEQLEKGNSLLTENPDLGFDAKAYAADPDRQYRLPEVKAGVCQDFRFNNVKYRVPPKSARYIDRAQLFALTAADQAITNAGLAESIEFGNRIGVMIGTISGSRHVENILRTRLDLLHRIIGSTQGISPEKATAIADATVAHFRKTLPRNTEDTTPGLLTNIVAGRIANFFGCNGANFTVDAACASAAFAIRAAMMNVKAGVCDYVITGGVDTHFYPAAMLVFKRLGLLSKNGTRFFDKSGSQGVNLAEGAAIQVVTTYGKAKEKGLPVLGEIRSVSLKSRAKESVFAVSDDLMADRIKSAHKEAGSRPEAIDHLDLFAFGHLFPDQMERKAVETAFSHASQIGFGNVKPECGYFKGANPAVVLTKLMLMQQKKTVLSHHSFDPATTILKDVTPLCARRKNRAVEHKRRPTFAANLHGFGGNHGHMVAGALPPWMTARSNAPLLPVFSPKRENGICVLLSGQGSQWVGMMQELYLKETEIRAFMDAAEEIFVAERKKSLLQMMFQGEGGDIASTENTQPAVFLASAALHSFLQNRGLCADAFIGHSIGEYTALYTAGLLDFATAFRLVLTRSRLMKTAATNTPGSIMAVFKGPEEVEALIQKSHLGLVYIANKNAPGQTVVSGAKGAMGQFAAFLTKKGVLFKKLHLSGAFHTPLFDAAAKGMQRAFSGVSFAQTDFSRVIANLTARPYPEEARIVKDQLIRQIVSPVEFLRSVEHLYEAGIRRFIEIGPNNILTRLVNGYKLADVTAMAAIDATRGEAKSFGLLLKSLREQGDIKPAESPREITTPRRINKETAAFMADPTNQTVSVPTNDEGFAAFLTTHPDLVRETLYEEYRKKTEARRLHAFESFGFYPGTVSIAGVSVGLPGKTRQVFEEDNFDRLLAGQNFIDPLTEEEKQGLVDRNITRLHKMPDGNARFLDITSTKEVIQLAGKLGYFDLAEEYGIENDYDITISLAIAAGLEALKDARIPLVMQYKDTASGTRIPAGLALPEPLQETTGVILTSLFPGWETLIEEVTRYCHHKYIVKPYQELEKMYYFLMEEVENNLVKENLTDWFFSVKKEKEAYGEYAFKRSFPANTTPLGSAHFARIIQAKGPNLQLSGACASTTQAIGVAEDWIRSGRCERVIVIGGEAATHPCQSPWISSGFLSLGAASTKKTVAEAAKPFDAKRNGTILSAGATGLVVERNDRIRKRGLNGQADILGTYLGNAAFHTTRIEVPHLAKEMGRFVRRVEKRHGLDRAAYTKEMIFMSHETYTPARGGSADAEIEALRDSFGDAVTRITITNTKGFTGHTLGAAIEDAVMVKALQTGQIPPVANLKTIPEHFRDLRFSNGEKGDFRYGLHFSAGFGSHFAFLFIRRVMENRAAENPLYTSWLQQISGMENPALQVKNKTLVILPAATTPAEPKTPTSFPEKETPRMQPANTPPHAGSILPRITQMVAELTGYTEEMLEKDLDLEADLGIDTVKQVEIFGKIAKTFRLEDTGDGNLRELSTIAKLAAFVADKTETETSPSPSSAPPSEEALTEKIRAIISEQTGYTEEMLADDLDLEADLGIDTVKQVEIFGRITKAFAIDTEEDVNLRALSTITKIRDFVAEKSNATAISDLSEPGPAPGPSETATADPTPAIRSIMAEITGYTEEMLADDLDLEADLGIDTVKQVEVFGKIMAHFALAEPEDVNLRALSSIRKIAEFVNRLSAEKPAKPIPSQEEPPPLPVSEKAAVFRFVPDLRKTEPAKGRFSLSGRKLLVTLDDKTDGTGLATPVCEALRAAGATLLTMGQNKSADFVCDLTDPEKTAKRCALVATEHPDLCGLILLHPFAKAASANRDRLPAALFAGLQKLAPCLNRKGAVIAMPTFQSAIFPTACAIREKGLRPDPVQAGLSGLLKTVAREFTDTRVKVTDFGEADFAAKAIATRFVTELLSGDTRVETGFCGNTRYVPVLRKETISETENLLSGRTLLVTGGASGITFAILQQAVQTTKDLTLILTGRSRLEDLDTALSRAEGPALMALLKERMPTAKPVTIKKTADRIRRAKETAANIRTLEEMGATVTYRSCDVTHVKAVQDLADAHPEIDAILHAAGLEESQILIKKEMDSFDRVFATKVKGMRNLLSACKDHDLKLIIGFSSVTAKFGNAAQCDYTAANDMVGKMILAEQVHRSDCICKVMAWTAWDGTGMAMDPTVRKVLHDRGLTFLPIREGVAYFMSECRHLASGESVFTGNDRRLDPDGLLPLPGEHPKVDWFLDETRKSTADQKTFTRTLALDRDPFLRDHAIGDVPLFLGATGIETLCEAALQVVNGNHVITLSDFSIPYGIKILKGRPKPISVTAVKQDEHTARCTITSAFVNPKGVLTGDPKLHYEGTVQAGNRRPKARMVECPSLPAVRYTGELKDLIYHPRRLFMEGVFQTVEAVEGFDGTTLVTTMADTSSRDFFAGTQAPPFKTPVVLLDAMFQTGGLFNMMDDGELVLPSKIRELQILDMPERHTAYTCITKKTASGKTGDLFSMQLVDAGGRLLIDIKDFEMIRIGTLPAAHAIKDRFTRVLPKAAG